MEENPYQVSGLFDGGLKKDLIEIIRPSKKASEKSFPAMKVETIIGFEKKTLYTLLGGLAALYVANKVIDKFWK